MKKILSTVLVTVMILSAIVAVALIPAAADETGDWVATAAPGAYGKNPDGSVDYTSTPDRPAPEYYYTDEGLVVSGEYSSLYGETPRFNVMSKEKYNLRDGISMSVRVDEFKYGGDMWFSFSIWDSPNIAQGDTSGQYGQGYTTLIRASGTRKYAFSAWTQLQSFISDQTYYVPEGPVRDAWTAIGMDGGSATNPLTFHPMVLDTSLATLGPEKDEDGKVTVTMNLTYDAATNLYSLEIANVPVNQIAINDYLNYRFPDGMAYIGFSINSTQTDCTVTTTVTEFNGSVPAGTDNVGTSGTREEIGAIIDPSTIPEGEPALFFDGNNANGDYKEAGKLSNFDSLTYTSNNDGTFTLKPQKPNATWVEVAPKKSVSYDAADFPYIAVMMRDFCNCIFAPGENTCIAETEALTGYYHTDTRYSSDDTHMFSGTPEQHYTRDTTNDGRDYKLYILDMTDANLTPDWSGRINGVKLVYNNIVLANEGQSQYDLCFVGYFKTYDEAFAYGDEYVAAREECKHENRITVPAVPATCTSLGSTEGEQCADCGHWFVSVTNTPLADHDADWTIITDATCLEAGSKSGTCKVCGADIEAQKIPALGHDIVAIVEAKDATCQEAGITAGQKCSRCDMIIEAQVEIPKGNHTPTALGKETESTCTEPGKTAGSKCSVCDEVLEEPVDKPLAHHTEVSIPGTPATCTTPGAEDFIYCEECGETIQAGDAIPATGHINTEKVTVDSTCTTAGSEKVMCKDCGAEVSSTTLPVAGHTEVAIGEAKDATCKEAGITAGKKCSVCGFVIEEQQPIPTTAHTIVAIGEEIPATCQAPGQTAGKKCSVCGTVTEAQAEIPQTGHVNTKEEITDATCEAPGSKKVICNDCGRQISSSIIPLAPHTEVAIGDAKDATCKEAGITAGKKCSVCDKTIEAQKTIAMLPHTEEVVPGTPATCTKTGLTDGKKCSVCDTVITAQTIVPLASHTEVEIPAVEATCTTEGSTAGKKCEVCGAVTVRQNTIAALGHTEVTDEAKAATCTETGLTVGKHCSVCEEVLTAQEEIPALGHTASAAWSADDSEHWQICARCSIEIEGSRAAHEEGSACPTCGHGCPHDNTTSVTVDATCSAEGKTTVTCVDCGVVVDETIIIKLPHTEEVVPGTPATCTKTGLTDGKKCSVCDEIITAQTTIPVTAHAYEDVEVLAPTCTTAGSGMEVCSVCGAEGTTFEIPVADHTEVEISAVGATCSTTGLTAGVKCEVCDATIVAQTATEKLPHTEVEVPAVDPTCTETGLTAGKKCSVCDEEIEAQETVDALGHINEEKTVESTCTVAGTKETVCTVCDFVSAHEELPLAPHTEVAIGEAKEPTCTEEGITAGVKCEKCPAIITPQTPIDKIAHTEVDIPAVEPTCTEAGSTAGKKCSVCNTVTVNTTTIPTIAHDEETVIVPSTCNKQGTETLVCKVCGHEGAKKTLPLAEHTPEPMGEAVAATCTSAGKTAGEICSVCKLVIKGPTMIPVIPHTEEVVPGKAATCTETGLTDGKKCSVCNAVTVAQTTTNALGHTEIDIPAVPATCTEDGYTAGKKCEVCDALIQATTVELATGHKYENVITTAPTCTEAGKQNVVCANCGDVKESDVVVEAIPHTPVAIGEAVEATCTAEGLTAGEKCFVCDTVIAAQAPIPMIEHDEVAYGEDKDATCTEDGSIAGTKCSVCDTVIVEESVIPKTGHTYDNRKDDTCNTCNEKREIATEKPTEKPNDNKGDDKKGEEKKGCGSVAGLSALAICATVSLAGVMCFKKKED